MTCPKCGAAMAERSLGEVVVRRCEGCASLFLDRADLGALIEAESDWHAARSSSTAPMPRITPDMIAPPTPRPRSRSYLDSLFQA